MNKYFSKNNYSYVLLASLPLLVFGGCASQDTTKSSEEVAPSITETNKLVNEKPDPIIMLVGQASEFDTQNTSSATTMSEETQPIASSMEEPVLYPPAIKPQEQRIGFAFDQTEVDTQYHKLLQQHAQYLAENKDLSLKVNGHTDSFGPKEYNKSLSKKRGEAVVKLLVEYGAPKDRIMVEGVADEEPLISATHQSEHRRVELDYQDQRLVSTD